jgi:hypothetical protein
MEIARAPRQYVPVAAPATTGHEAVESGEVTAVRAWTAALRSCGGARYVKFGRADILREDFNRDCGLVGPNRRMM